MFGVRNAWKEFCAEIREVLDENARLKAENAKLRKLVIETWRCCPVSEGDCARCPHYIEERDEDWCDIPILMRELGIIGVDEVEGS